MTQVGKYIIQNLEDGIFKIIYDRNKYIISNVSSRENLILSGNVNLSEEAHEKEITHILKIRRRRLKRELLELNNLI